MFNSCGDNKSHSVVIKSEQDSVIDKITVWNVTGTFTEQEDSALSRTSIYLPDTLSLLKSSVLTRNCGTMDIICLNMDNLT